RVENRVLRLLSSGAQFAKRKRLAEHRADAQYLVALVCDTIQTVADRLLNALRDQQLGDVAPLPATAFAPDRTFFNEGLQDFFDEEGIAFCFVVHCIGKVVADSLSEQGAKLGSRFVPVKTAKDNPRDQAFAVPID